MGLITFDLEFIVFQRALQRHLFAMYKMLKEKRVVLDVDFVTFTLHKLTQVIRFSTSPSKMMNREFNIEISLWAHRKIPDPFSLLRLQLSPALSLRPTSARTTWSVWSCTPGVWWIITSSWTWSPLWLACFSSNSSVTSLCQLHSV